MVGDETTPTCLLLLLLLLRLQPRVLQVEVCGV
jgi:hypothetical protein